MTQKTTVKKELPAATKSSVNTIQDKIAKVNKILLNGEPSNVSHDSYGGYTGYSPQAIIDAVNEIFSPHGWGFRDIVTKVSQRDDKLAISNVAVWVGTKEEEKTAYGQSRVTRGDVGDALKGAQTDAIKKALSYFSIGNRAYLGLLQVPSAEKPVTRTVQGAETPASRPATGQSVSEDECPHGNIIVLTSGPKAKNPGKKFKKCEDCGAFRGWAEEKTKARSEDEEEPMPESVGSEDVRPDDVPF